MKASRTMTCAKARLYVLLPCMTLILSACHK